VANGNRTCTPADPIVAAANIRQWASLASPTLGIAQIDQYPNQGTDRCATLSSAILIPGDGLEWTTRKNSA